MKTVGIVAEYNPFHNGHAYQIQYAREKLGADAVVVVMSGDFVQRGAPALLPKHTRARMAILGGADLVLELPACISTASAEYFAGGAVQLLDSLGIVDMLCFGAETDDLASMTALASILESETPEYKAALARGLRRGESFPAARKSALSSICKKEFPNAADLLSTPNNILGVEYCRALLRIKSSIRPCPLLRRGSAYTSCDLISGSGTPSADPAARFPSANPAARFPSADPAARFPSAAAIRRNLDSPLLQDGMPDNVRALLSSAVARHAYLTESDLNGILSGILFLSPPQQLRGFRDMSEDLYRRILRHRYEFSDYHQFAELLKTKEITQARIRRVLLAMVLGLTAVPETVPYARILGFRRDQGDLLHMLKCSSRVPVIVKPKKAPEQLDSASLSLFEENTRISNFYQGLLSKKSGVPFVHEYQKPMVIV